MRYISTRGQAPALNFEDVLLAGLASDGGLYVPENLPRFTQEEIASWAGLPYHELAFRVMRPFVTGSIPDTDFKMILEETYGAFAHNAVAPLRQLNGNEWVLELIENRGCPRLFSTADLESAVLWGVQRESGQSRYLWARDRRWRYL